MHNIISPEVYFLSVAPVGARPHHRRKNTTVEQEEGQQNKPARARDLERQQTMPIKNLVLALRFWAKSGLGSKMAAQPLHKALAQGVHNPYTTPLSISNLFWKDYPGLPARVHAWFLWFPIDFLLISNDFLLISYDFL